MVLDLIVNNTFGSVVPALNVQRLCSNDFETCLENAQRITNDDLNWKINDDILYSCFIWRK